MKFSKRRRTFDSGKALSIDLRRAILDEAVLAGGDTVTTVTGHFHGSYEVIANKVSCPAKDFFPPQN